MQIPGLAADIRGAIFDFDGTLVDSMPTWSGKMLHLLQSHGVAYPPDIIRTITPLGDAGAARYFQRQLGLALPRGQIQQELDAYALPRYRDSIPAKPGAAQVLAALSAGGVALCVLTASPQQMLQPCLRRTGLADFLRFAWCCDDLGLTKTQPEIYDRTCAQLGTPPQQTLFFDDNLLALATGAAAGLVTVGVYDASSAADEPAIRQVCARYLPDWPSLFAAPAAP